MDMFLSYPDEVYFERHVMKFLPETCRAHQIWYLFFIIFILKIKITQNREHGKIYLRFYYYHCVDTTAGTLSTLPLYARKTPQPTIARIASIEWFPFSRDIEGWKHGFSFQKAQMIALSLYDSYGYFINQNIV
jgi:hypothetical protein